MKRKYALMTSSKRPTTSAAQIIRDEDVTFTTTTAKVYMLRFRPWEVVFTVGFATYEQALTAERKVKSRKSKKMVRLLVEGSIKIEDYL